MVSLLRPVGDDLERPRRAELVDLLPVLDHHPAWRLSVSRKSLICLYCGQLALPS